MSNPPMDEHIKNKLSNYAPEVPPHIWENIAREKDRKKPAGFWLPRSYKKGLGVLLGILLTGVAAMLYQYQKEDDARGISKLVAPVETPAAKTGNGSLSENPEETAGNNTANNNQVITSPAAELNTTGSNSTTANKNAPSSNTTTTAITNNNHKITLTSSANDEAPVGHAKQSRTTKGKAKSAYKVTNAVADAGNENSLPPDSETAAMEDQLLSPVVTDVTTIAVNAGTLTRVSKPVLPLVNIPCPESEKNIAGNKRYIEIYGGPDYAIRNLSDTGNSVYLQKRKESTHFTSAFSAGLRYTKVFGNGMSFRTGFNYSQINEKFKYAEGNIIQVVYITNGNGDTTGSYTTSGTRYKTTINKYRTIDIPLMLGYELGNSRLHVNFNAGAIVNLYSWQKGDVLDTSYRPVSITTGKPSSPYQFRNNVGIGFIGAVSVYYKVTNRLHILAEPYFRYNFSPASKSELTLKQKYNTAGLRLGIRLDF